MTEVSNWQDFFELTKRMRETQKEYFKTKNFAVLEESKKLESDIDRAIKKIDRTQQEARIKKIQKDLFER